MNLENWNSLNKALQARELADQHFGLRDERTFWAYLLKHCYGELGELEIANELYRSSGHCHGAAGNQLQHRVADS